MSFGNNGKAIANIKERSNSRPNDAAFSVITQSDDKIIVVGIIEDIDFQGFEWHTLQEPTVSAGCAIVRYDQNGRLDPIFGSDKNGVVMTSLSNKDNFFTDVIVQPDDKIICVGAARNVDTNKVELVLVRYTKDGLLDFEFGKKIT